MQHMQLPVNLFVVRHGESIGNLSKRMSESGDHSRIERLKGTHTSKWKLTDKGKTQAGKAGVFLAKLLEEKQLYLDRAYVSSFARAISTAQLLDLPYAQWRMDNRITERDWGKLDKMTEEERREHFSDDLKMREVEPYFWAPPGGESFNSLLIRVRDFIASVARVGVENVVVVCHGEVMKAIRIIFMHLKPWEYAKMEFSKESLDRVHNCQIDHYSRRHPQTFQLSRRLEWFQAYRPAEDQGIVIPWKNLPQKLMSNGELGLIADDLTKDFVDFPG